jgi:hypothetical protein
MFEIWNWLKGDILIRYGFLLKNDFYFQHWNKSKMDEDSCLTKLVNGYRQVNNLIDWDSWSYVSVPSYQCINLIYAISDGNTRVVETLNTGGLNFSIFRSSVRWGTLEMVKKYIIYAYYEYLFEFIDRSILNPDNRVFPFLIKYTRDIVKNDPVKKSKFDRYIKRLSENIRKCVEELKYIH